MRKLPISSKPGVDLDKMTIYLWFSSHFSYTIFFMNLKHLIKVYGLF